MTPEPLLLLWAILLVLAVQVVRIWWDLWRGK